MDAAEALTMIRMLADGEDPITGEILPDAGPYQSARVLRALLVAATALEEQIRRETKPAKESKEKPANAGKGWSDEEDERLRRSFAELRAVGTERQAIKSLADAHGRTVSAIESRLLRLGLITSEPGGHTPVPPV
jgi:hypothetical protein